MKIESNQRLCLFVLALVVMIQPAWSQSDRPAVTNSIGQSLQFIPAGSFIMGGRNPGEGGFYKDHVEYDSADERPRHPVRLTKPFYLGTTEVTIAQFKEFQKATAYKTTAEQSGNGIVGFAIHEPEQDKRAKFAFRKKPEFSWQATGFPQQDTHPVVGVSWQDAQEFCQWLSKKEKQKCRLPTEAEWEYACRATSDSYFSWGASYKKLHQLANVGNAELERAHPMRVLIQWIVDPKQGPSDSHIYTAPVGSFPANAWGLKDMHGNVWEWCQDRYLDTSYSGYRAPSYGLPIPRAIDPFNQKTFNTDGDWRVIRGGSWFTAPLSARSAVRAYYEAADAAAYIGFRVAREASPQDIAAARQAYESQERSRAIVKQAIGKFGSEKGTDLRAQFSGTLTPEVAKELKQIGGLSEIRVSSNAKMDGELIRELAAVPDLKILNLHHSGVTVTDEHFAPLAKRKELEGLQITAYPTLTDDVLKYFGQLTNLRRLHLQGEQLTDNGLRQLSHLTKLQALGIQSTRSNGEVLAELKQAPLEVLAVRRISDETAQLLENFPSLTSLTVYDSPMTDRGFKVITNLRRLQTLRIRNCPQITSEGFPGLKKMRSLKSLDLIDTPIGDESLALLSNLGLRTLRLNSEQITDTGM